MAAHKTFPDIYIVYYFVLSIFCVKYQKPAQFKYSIYINTNWKIVRRKTFFYFKTMKATISKSSNRLVLTMCV